MENWQTQIYETPIWLIKNLFGIIIASLLIVVILSKTDFIRQFFRIAKLSINIKNYIKISALILIILIVLLLEVRFRVLNTFLFNGLYTSLEEKYWSGFWFFALMNLGLIGTRSINFVIDKYLDQVLQINWLNRINEKFIELWFSHQNYYHKSFNEVLVDNIDQTIQIDLHGFIESTSKFIRGMISSVVSTIEFGVVLWGLSGIITVLGIEIPRAMVFFVFIYVIVATSIALKIGMPLINLNFIKERLNGNYRYNLIRTKEYSESIAFYQGESLEKNSLYHNFHDIIRNRWKIVHRTLALKGFNYGFTESVKIFPLMLQAPRYFSGQIKLGDMYQTMQSFTRLQEALSFFREFYEQFTAYHAQINRLTVFLDSMQQKPLQQKPNRTYCENSVIASNIDIIHDGGTPLLTDIKFSLNQGDRLLVTGKSGSGKTSLLRVLAGLWTHHSTGTICLPKHERLMFVPQSVYLPKGTLSDALHYPKTNHLYPEEEMTKYLCLCQLPHLVPLLNENRDWVKILSTGELQRLSFARIFLHKPFCIFLDEATSALDEENEKILYQLLIKELKNSIIISVAHRHTVSQFHNKLLKIDG